MPLAKILSKLGLGKITILHGPLSAQTLIENPGTEQPTVSSAQGFDSIILDAEAAFNQWRSVPGPKRGELIRVLGNNFRRHKDTLVSVVSLETEKSYQEAQDEIQEMIDICDFVVDLSQQLYGLAIVSKHTDHHATKTWHPITSVNIISDLNHPSAVWCWNTTLAVICGNSVVWELPVKTPITALACQKIFEDTCKEVGNIPKGLLQLLNDKVKTKTPLLSRGQIPIMRYDRIWSLMI